MFVLDDVANDAHAQSGALPDGFRGVEVLVETLLHFVIHARYSKTAFYIHDGSGTL